MKSFLLKISSPEGDLFCGEALMLRVRGTEGELAVMAGHIPFVTYVKPCECKIVLEDGTEQMGSISGGMLNVSRDQVTLLTGTVNWK